VHLSQKITAMHSVGLQILTAAPSEINSAFSCHGIVKWVSAFGRGTIMKAGCLEIYWNYFSS